MTEAEWLACTDPVPMLDHLSSKMSQRKIRLFASALARRTWALLVNKQSRKAIVMAERHADGLAADSKLLSAHRAAETVHLKTCAVARTKTPERGGAEDAESFAAALAVWATGQNPFCTRSSDGNYVFLSRVLQARLAGGFVWKAFDEYRSQAHLLRDLIGNPFRSIVIAPSWMRWRDRMIERLAQHIYEERHFEDLPILADALEEAGCDNIDILNHCRGVGEHVCGCWVIDTLLGKE